ncbi:MAG TPA: hypothetical protein VFB38_18110 [Chthonomonadaceae bacterium]|nr:hypothetical protein [Chthonomonadaceae bacterium]
MAKRKQIGICHICGLEGPLSKEHVPPQAAFNDRAVITVNFERAMSLGPDEEITLKDGKQQQGGASMYTLCGQCNNNTGKWYGNAFVDWCYQGMDILIRANGRPSLIYLYHAFPLRIIKQIVTMFCSVNSPKMAAKYPALVDFVLCKEKRYLPPKFRFFVYYNIEGCYRYAGITAGMRIDRGKHSLFSEISFPPFGYVMALDSEPPDERLFEITHFSRYRYNDFLDTEMHLPVLPTHLALPGDYRTKEEIREQIARAS